MRPRSRRTAEIEDATPRKRPAGSRQAVAHRSRSIAAVTGDQAAIADWEGSRSELRTLVQAGESCDPRSCSVCLHDRAERISCTQGRRFRVAHDSSPWSNRPSGPAQAGRADGSTPRESRRTCTCASGLRSTRAAGSESVREGAGRKSNTRDRVYDSHAGAARKELA